MADKKEIGNFGEEFTSKFLKKNGYKILERNYHSRYGEIDIIASKGGILAFVEVKTRSQDSLFKGREAVDFFKSQKCLKTAQVYMVKNQTDLQPRFDVSELVINQNGRKIEVIEHNYIENTMD